MTVIVLCRTESDLMRSGWSGVLHGGNGRKKGLEEILFQLRVF